MKLNQKISDAERIVINLASPISWIAIVVLSISMTIGIVFYDKMFLQYQLDLGASGWQYIWTQFKAPISVFLAGTTIYGIILAIKRTIILERQAELNFEQFRITRHNILMNNYFTHQKEFLRMMSDFRSSTSLYGSQGNDVDQDFYRKLYVYIFGKKFESTNMIDKTKIESIQKIIDEVLLLFPNDVKQRSDIVAKLFQNLGFQEKIISDHVHIGQNSLDSHVQDSLKILIKIIEFSNQEDELERLEEIREIL